MGKKSKSILETIEAEIVKDAGEFVVDKVKQKVLKIGEISVLIILGFILVSFGLAEVIASYFPVLEGGFNYILLGVFFLIVSFGLKV